MEPQAPQDPAAQPELAERVARLEVQFIKLVPGDKAFFNQTAI